MSDRPTHDAWTHTSRGKLLDLLSPCPTAVDIGEIARALGYLCRYAGGVSDFYSVAEHSVLLSRWLLEETGSEELALAGLLHDVAEAYTGDLTWPMQVAVLLAGDGAARTRYRAVQRGVERAILTHLGLAELEGALHGPQIQEADKRILLDERAALLQPGPRWPIEDDGLTPLGVDLHLWGPDQAGRLWLRELQRLTMVGVESLGFVVLP